MFFFLGILPIIAQQNDSIYISIDDLRTITKMTEDLRYTKMELEVADSIITHQRNIIEKKDEIIDIKTIELQENIKKSQKEKRNIGIMSGVTGLVLGIVISVIL